MKKIEKKKAETETLNRTWFPVLKTARGILQELHLLLASYKEHKKVFPDVPVIRFRTGKSLKDNLITTALLKTNETGI